MPPKKGAAVVAEAALEAAGEAPDEVAEHQRSPWLVLSEEQYLQLSSTEPSQLASAVHDLSTLKSRPVRVHTDILLEFLHHHLEHCILSQYTHAQAAVYLRIVQALFQQAVLSEKAEEYTPETAAEFVQAELMREVTQEWEQKGHKLFSLEQLNAAAQFIGTSMLRNLLAYRHALTPLRELRHPEPERSAENSP